MASWQHKVGAVATVASFLALLVWTQSFACRAEDEQTPSENDGGAVIEVAKVPHYTKLLEWINDVKRPGFELLKAARQNGYLIAVFKTEDGDVAVCHHRLEEKAVANSFEVADLEGKDLGDNSESRRGKTLVRTMKTPTSTTELFDGHIYPLRRPVPKKVRVIVNELEGEIEAGLVPDRQRAIFNEVIEME